MSYNNTIRTNTLLFDSYICLDLASSYCEYANSLGIYQDSIFFGNDFNEPTVRKIDCNPFIGSGLIDSPCIYNETELTNCTAENSTCIEVIIYDQSDYDNNYFDNY